jgi:hypothetical protein
MAFIKTNNQVLKEFKRFKRMVETIINQKMEILQFNHGGEYSSMEFQ